MKITQRIDKSQIHFYIVKLKEKGFQKVADRHTKYAYIVCFQRGEERLTMKYTNNGWLTII